jgi:hypothetical protein
LMEAKRVTEEIRKRVSQDCRKWCLRPWTSNHLDDLEHRPSVNFAIYQRFLVDGVTTNCPATTHQVRSRPCLYVSLHCEYLPNPQNASSNTDTASRPLHTLHELHHSILKSCSRKLCFSSNSFSNHTGPSYPSDSEISSARFTVPTNTATLPQAAGGPQDTTAQAIPVATEVIATNPDIPTQQCQSCGVDEHTERAGGRIA